GAHVVPRKPQRGRLTRNVDPPGPRRLGEQLVAPPRPRRVRAGAHGRPGQSRHIHPFISTLDIMSLVAARGPLGPNPTGWFSPPIPAGVVSVEPHLRRVQAVVGDRIVIDTERALLVHRAGHPLSYAFPAGDVGDLLHEPEPDAPGYVRVPWDAVDTWFEEGR